MRIDESGNIGIGTTTPSSFIELKKSFSPVLKFVGGPAPGDGPSISLYNSTNLRITLSAQGLDPGVYINGGGRVSTSGLGNLLLLADGSTNQMVLGTNGNVGIGGTVPITPLHVLKMGNNTQDILTLQRGTNTTLPDIGTTNVNFIHEGDSWKNVNCGRLSWEVTDITDKSYNANFRIYTMGDGGALSNTFTLMGNGFVGIGTDAPSNTLHVIAKADPLRIEGLQTTTEENILVADNNGVVSTRLMSSLDAGGWFLIGNGHTDPATNFIGTSDDNPLVFRTNSIEAMRINEAGKLGIGTINSTEKININGNILFTNDNTISTIGIQGVGANSTPGRHLKIFAGPHASDLGTSGNLYLDGGANPGPSKGNVLIASDNPGLVGVRTNNPNSAFQIIGSFATTIVSKSANYGLGINDQIVLCTAVMTATLPNTVGIAGRQYTIKRTFSGGSAVTVGTTSSQTIDGVTTYSLAAQWQFVTVVSDGANWLIIGKN